MTVEAATGFEPVNDGFANHCLTTWPRRRSVMHFSRRYPLVKLSALPVQPTFYARILEFVPVVVAFSVFLGIHVCETKHIVSKGVQRVDRHDQHEPVGKLADKL